jgi:hypothetical protein
MGDKHTQTFKFEGIHVTVPILLQQGVCHLTTHLCHIFRAFLARRYTPKAWRQAKVMFVPQPGKDNYTEAIAHHSISLSSLMLKMSEKLVERHIRDENLRLYPLCRNQAGKSTETALHHMITHRGSSGKHTSYTSCFLREIGNFQ